VAPTAIRVVTIGIMFCIRLFTLLMPEPLEFLILLLHEGKKSSTLREKFSLEISFHPESRLKKPAYTGICGIRKIKETVMRAIILFISL